MDGNLKINLGRKSIYYLIALFLLSGPAGGKEESKQPINPLDLLRPHLKSVMLSVATGDPVPAPVQARSEKADVQPEKTVSSNPLHDQDRYQVRQGDTCWAIAKRYGMSVEELKALNPGLNPEKIRSGQYLQVRRTATASRGRSGPRNAPVTAQSPFPLHHPLAGAKLTSRYGMRWGRMHRGIDLAAPAGTPIKAAASGTVIFAGWQRGYGLMIILDHGTCKTKYAHNTENLVRVGDEVLRGQPIAKVGRTGNATGNHLHFELEVDGKTVDPLLYLR
ncbi:MAG: peptidoglycan DD-metalloendopeptidase family protein [Firmicutes bacterium]|nr:peptidoglycan DD-metalloendopeptidase family protein [Bacillota bacterium]